MDLKQLRYLVAVADELNFTRAAEKCHISQPPLSRAISLLEAEIGARLIDRDTHRVRMTPAGASLAAEARRALAALGEATDQARRIDQGLAGRLDFGFGGTPVYSTLPELVRRFRLTHPAVELHFHAMPVLRQMDALRTGEIDLGILRLPVHDEEIETRHVHSEPLIFALPEGEARANVPGPLALAQFAGRPFIAYEPRRGFGYHSDLLALCRIAGFEPRIAHEAASTEVVAGIVACGEGIALVPASARRLRMRGVVFRRLDDTGLPRNLTQVEFALAWRRSQPSPAAVEFAATVQG